LKQLKPSLIFSLLLKQHFPTGSFDIHVSQWKPAGEISLQHFIPCATKLTAIVQLLLVIQYRNQGQEQGSKEDLLSSFLESTL